MTLADRIKVVDDEIRRAARSVGQVRERIKIGEEIVAKGGGQAVRDMVAGERANLEELERRLARLRVRRAVLVA